MNYKLKYNKYYFKFNNLKKQLGGTIPINFLSSIECMLCLQNITTFVEIGLCNKNEHIFHRKCLNKWLETNNTCPTCSDPIQVEPLKSPTIQQPFDVIENIVQDGLYIGKSVVLADIERTRILYKEFSTEHIMTISITSPIITIEKQALEFNKLKQIILPNTLTSIGDEAFCYNHLQSITIPNSVTSIGNEAFYQNRLIYVEIPNSVITIGDEAFAYNNLTSLFIPESVIHIGNEAFKSNNLRRVTIPRRFKPRLYLIFSSVSGIRFTFTPTIICPIWSNLKLR